MFLEGADRKFVLQRYQRASISFNSTAMNKMIQNKNTILKT